MKVWYENYGEDADGNRGIRTLFSELDDSIDERGHIVYKLANMFEEDWELDLTKVIKDMAVLSDCGECEFEHDINPAEYAWEVYEELALRLDGSEGDEFTGLLQEFKIEAFKTLSLDQHFKECLDNLNSSLKMVELKFKREIKGWCHD